MIATTIASCKDTSNWSLWQLHHVNDPLDILTYRMLYIWCFLPYLCYSFWWLFRSLLEFYKHFTNSIQQSAQKISIYRRAARKDSVTNKTLQTDRMWDAGSYNEEKITTLVLSDVHVMHRRLQKTGVKLDAPQKKRISAVVDALHMLWITTNVL